MNAKLKSLAAGMGPSPNFDNNLFEPKNTTGAGPDM